MKGDEKIGRRCAMGCETWPNDTAYKDCPTCHRPTRLYRGVHPLTAAEAKAIKVRAEFETYYEHVHVKDLDPLTDAELARLGIT